ncbi:transporter substrate-binding domain-containing protein [Ancylobacter sp. MQZ15Z-1]|uniref:Transporter substrate-binding domain-containing protein n=1 Tax=Ancylobacter mangrovi TaxID=2972472 RepID=A0A9X2PHP6_9HYPH|nr:transporter substrate-binding domain-containing protein [Ancylobacter mangrovi]MCS0497296.1 transporter substrate-binding domain-containing protein [Ancylobacter mangrovi]
MNLSGLIGRASSICMIVAALGASLPGVSHAAAPEKVTIATEGAFPPFNQTEADGSFTGFEIDLGNAICKHAGLECTWVKQDFSGMIPALQAKKYDFIFSYMSINDERAKVGLFSIPYITDQFRFYGPKGSAVTLPAGLDGKSVGVLSGSTGERFIKEKWGDKVDVRGYDNLDQVNADLEAGRIDYGFNAQLPVSVFLASPEGAGYAWFGPSYSDPLLGRGAGAMFRKDETALRDKVNDAIRAVYADGTFKEIAARYFKPGVDVSAEPLWK